MKWRDAEENARLVLGDGRREVHFAFEPIEGEVAGRSAFGEHPPGRDSRFEFVEALTHPTDGLLHGHVVTRSPREVERLGGFGEPRRAFVDLLGRECIDLGALLRRERRKRHQR